MIRKEEVFEILRFIRDQRIYSGDIYRIIGFEYPPVQQFDFLLWNKTLQAEVGVEIKELHDVYDDGISHQGHVKHFYKKIKPALDALIRVEGGNGQPIVFVEMPDIDMTSRLAPEKKVEKLYSELKNKDKVKSGRTPGPPIYLPGSGVQDDIGRRIEDGIRKCVAKAAEQLSDGSAMLRYVIIVNRYIHAVPEEVRRVIGKIIEGEGIQKKIDKVFLSNAGSITAYGDNKIFDKTEQVYPAA